MFPSQYRLRRDQDIKRVLSAKTGVFDQVSGVKFVANNQKVSRFSVVVPNKVTKVAVKRNTLRRQYREILRLHLSEIRPGLDVLVLLSKPALDLTYEEKQDRMMHVLRKAKLLV